MHLGERVDPDLRVLRGEAGRGHDTAPVRERQVEAGDVRVLAVTSPERVEALKDVPTLKEKGIDLEFANWRGVVAPPGLSEEDKQVWIDAFSKMHESASWKAVLEEKGWVDAFATGDEFGVFLTRQDKMVADLLAELGPV